MVNSFFYYVMMIWLAALLAITGIAVIRMSTSVERILAFDTFSLILIVPLALFATWQGSSFYLDVALLLAMFSFLATLVAARYHSMTRP